MNLGSLGSLLLRAAAGGGGGGAPHTSGSLQLGPVFGRVAFFLNNNNQLLGHVPAELGYL